MRFGYWTPTYGGWLRNVADEQTPATFEHIARIAETGLSEAAFLMFFFAAFALVVAGIFGWYAKRYPMQDHYRSA